MERGTLLTDAIMLSLFFLAWTRYRGMNIEEVAHSDPSAIITTPIDFEKGLNDKDAYDIAVKIGVESESSR